MQFVRTPIYVQEEQVIDGEFSEMVMNTADRIVNIIWNKKIQKYHETVSESIYDTFQIYNNLFTHALQLHKTDEAVADAYDYISRLSENVNWYEWSSQSLEYHYLGEEVEEIISDEADIFYDLTIIQCAWQQLAESCLFEILKHLVWFSEEDEENTEAFKAIHDELLTEHIRYELEEHFDLGQETKVDELRTGSYWSTFLVKYKKG